MKIDCSLTNSIWKLCSLCPKSITVILRNRTDSRTIIIIIKIITYFIKKSKDYDCLGKNDEVVFEFLLRYWSWVIGPQVNLQWPLHGTSHSFRLILTDVGKIKYCQELSRTPTTLTPRKRTTRLRSVIIITSWSWWVVRVKMI